LVFTTKEPPPATLLSVWFSSAHEARESLFRGDANSRRSPLLAFLRFQRAGRYNRFSCPSGLFHPDNAPEFSAFRVLILPEIRGCLQSRSSLAVCGAGRLAALASRRFRRFGPSGNRDTPDTVLRVTDNPLPSWLFPFKALPFAVVATSFLATSSFELSPSHGTVTPNRKSAP
jgi:hypothetical protein